VQLAARGGKVEQTQLWVDGVAQPNHTQSDDTRYYWRDASVSPSSLGFHWNHNAKSYFLVGYFMGENMERMIPLLLP